MSLLSFLVLDLTLSIVAASEGANDPFQMNIDQMLDRGFMPEFDFSDFFKRLPEQGRDEDEEANNHRTDKDQLSKIVIIFLALFFVSCKKRLMETFLLQKAIQPSFIQLTCSLAMPSASQQCAYIVPWTLADVGRLVFYSKDLATDFWPLFSSNSNSRREIMESLSQIGLSQFSAGHEGEQAIIE